MTDDKPHLDAAQFGGICFDRVKGPEPDEAEPDEIADANGHCPKCGSPHFMAYAGLWVQCLACQSRRWLQ